MNSSSLSQRLQTLAKESNNRTKAGQLRAVIDDVEAAMSAGVRQSEIIATLAEEGLIMSPATFETTLRRIRNQREKAGVKTKNTFSALQASRNAVRAEILKPVEDELPSHDPKSIDKIVRAVPDLAQLAKLGKSKRK